MKGRHQAKLSWLLLAVFAPAVAQADTAVPGCLPGAATAAVVTGVEDDATLTLADGGRVRLVGVLPVRLIEGAASDAALKLNDLASAARDLLRDRLVGQKVLLRQHGRARDRYDRLLAHVHTQTGEWLQQSLLRQGLARAFSFADNRACIEEMLRIETEARQAKRGLWRFRIFRPLQADEPETILRQHYRFTLVEGHVHKVTEAGRWTFVNFAEDWKSDFTVAIERQHRRGLAAEGFDAAALAGRRIRVRGVIERWNGPAIKLTHKEQVEVLESAAPDRPSTAAEALPDPGEAPPPAPREP